MADIEPPSFSLGLDFEFPPPPPPKPTPSEPLEPEPPSFSLGLDFDNPPPPPPKPIEPEPPSFSLGLDFDNIQPPPPPRPKPIPPESIDPPSFSLGLDFDIEPSSLIRNPNDDVNGDDSSKLWVSDSEPDSPESTRFNSRFRCLRRGGPSIVVQIARDMPNSVVDDIEDFSEEDIVRTDPSRVSQHQTLNSSSKLPLSGCGVLRKPLDTTIHVRKNKQDSSLPPSTSVASNKGKSVFPDFTSSPLRRFQLIDSDSDDQTEAVKLKGNTSEVDLSKNIMKNKINYGSNRTPQNQDLWKDFRVDCNVSVPTPVFDELLEEYYGGKQNKMDLGYWECGSSGIASTSNNARVFQETDDAETTGLPCHSYFFHGDDRIRRLVRSRLPYFSPINMSGDAGNIAHNASSINYRGQFGPTANRTAGRNVNTEKSSKRAPKRRKKANTVGNSQETGTWVDPRQTTNTPQNAGKRRVRADGQSSGHWVNADNGKKVYVTRTGKELTGRIAYIRYKKENGGFKKTRKKRASKKK